MAEEIKVTNVGGQGDIASEATLASLVKSIEKLARQTGKDPRSEAGKVQAAHNKATTEGIKVSRKYRDAVNEKTEATEQATATTREFSNSLRGVLMGAIGQVVGSLHGLSNEFLQGGTELNDFSKHLPLIGSYLTPLAKYLDRSVSHFRDLSSSGASFNNSLIEMRSSAISAELNLSEFAGLVSSNTESLRFLGTTVTTGIAEFNKLNKELKDVGEWTNLKEMGFTVEEINEGLLDYSSLIGRLGLRQRMTTEQLATSAAEYLRQLDGLAKITGRTRKELEAQVRQLSEDAAFRALQNQFEEGSEQFKNFRSSMALISGLPESVASGLRDLADGIPQTEEGVALLAAAGPQIREAMLQIADGADPQVLIDALSGAGADIERFANLEGQARAVFISQLRQQNPVLADILDSATRLQEVGTANLEEALQEQSRRDEITQSMVAFDDSVRRVRSSIQGLFVDSGLFETLASGMSAFADIINSPEFLEGVEGITEKLSEEINKILNAFKEGGLEGGLTHIVGPGGPLEQAVVGAVSGLSNVIGTAFQEAITNPKVIAAIAGALAIAGAGAAFGGKVLGGAGAGLGAGAAGLGAGVGKGAGALISGVGSGLAAAGAKAPLIAAGGAAIGAAIAAIGAGLAGASYLLGKTLPGLAEGIKTFEELDGDALKNAGDGMVSLSLGMAAFAGGSVVSGMGNLAGNISEGIVSFFGGTNPLEKLEEFSQFNIDADRVKNNAEALVAFSRAMATSGVGEVASGWGRIAGGIAGGIANFFEVDTPYDKIREFGEQDLNAESVLRNAEVMQAMANALSAISGSEITAIKIDRDFFFGLDALQQVGPGLGTTVEHLQNLAEIRGLDQNISVLRNGFDAEGVRTFNRAMEDLVETLEQLNEVLADDNTDWLGRQRGASAGEIVQQINTANQGNAENISRLNSLMSQVAETLQLMYENDQKIERNTSRIQGGNIASGRVSNL